MSRQEEIRQLIDTYVGDVCLYPDTGCTSESGHRCFPGYCDSTEGAYRCLLKRLGELGVVMTAERELPRIGWFWKNCKQQRSKPAKICLECPFVDCATGKTKAGYAVTELLIDKEEQ